MTIFLHNFNIYTDIVNLFKPKYENKDYCKMLKEALTKCKANNPHYYNKCDELEKFINSISCNSDNLDIIKPPVKNYHNFNWQYIK